MAVRLLPHQLDRPAAGRHDADLRAQHLGALRTEHRDRPGRLRSAASTRSQAGAGTGDGLPARRDRAAERDISVFDNGAHPEVHPQSRAIVLSAQPQARTERCWPATSTARRRCPPAVRATSRRSPRRHLRRLGRRAVLLGIRRQRAAAVRRPHARLLPGTIAPIASPGRPAPAPPGDRGEHARAGGQMTVYASWNGATEVASWQVLAGPSPSSCAAGNAPKSGFETALATPGWVGPTTYVAVQALNGAGAVIGTSATIKG